MAPRLLHAISCVPHSATKGPIVRIAWASSLHLQPWVDVQAAAVPPAQAAVEGDVLALLRGLVVPAAVEHVAFNRCLRMRNGGRLYINPRLQVQR